MNLKFYQLPAFGRCGIEENDDCIVRILLGSEATGIDRGVESAVMAETARQLWEYTQGERFEFTVPVSPLGTRFQQTVWKVLRGISWGESTTYGMIAQKISVDGGARAVGNAVGANPIPILIPCHRVLAAGGRLGGFRLGLEIKAKLLELEHISYHDRKIEKI